MIYRECEPIRLRILPLAIDQVHMLSTVTAVDVRAVVEADSERYAEVWKALAQLEIK